ncbi:flagellar basal body-associated FliL family protein [Desulfocucumis palustris]|nr:flagellar basal body-associated FliL family protein [Desulfocucumis palustris]
MAGKKQTGNEGENTAKSKKNNGGIAKIVAIALGSVIFGAVVVGALAYFIGIPGLAPKAKAAAPPEMEQLDLGDRVINLADEDGSRYLRVKIVLEYPKNEKFAQELEKEKPFIQESILHILRTKTVDDIRPVPKEEEVKAEIINSINKKLQKGKVEKIYFTDFLIQ